MIQPQQLAPRSVSRLVLACVLGLCAFPSFAQSSAGCGTTLFSPACQGTSAASTDDASAPETDASDSADTAQRSEQTAGVYRDSAGMDKTQSRSQKSNYIPPTPPEPLTDFQKLVRETTGYSVPIFGRDLFQRPPSTFATADIPVTADYVVGPGDQVLVRIWGAGGTSGNNELTVDASGNIYIPKVGAVQVAGLRANELQDRISAEVAHSFRNFRISVSIGHLRSIQVYVVGNARRPGAYTISGLSTVLNALFTSGGPSAQGSLRHIQVRRGKTTLPEVDLYDLLLRGDKSTDVRLESGDTIFIPPVGPQVAVGGSVRHPGIYELKNSTTLEDVLSLAGGFSATGASGKIRLERIGPDYFRHSTTVTMDDAARSMAMRDGDILYADHVSRGYEKSVTVRGNLANPGRFAWHDGMHLSEIIPDGASLLTNDYWKERNRLGIPTPLFEPAPLPTRRPQTRSTSTNKTPVNGSTKSDQNTRTNPEQTEYQPLIEPAYTAEDYATRLPPAKEEPRETLTPEESGVARQGVQSDPTQLPYDSEETQATAPNGKSVDVSRDRGPRAVDAEELKKRRATTNTIHIPAPEINWSYAVIERLDPKTLKSSLIPFNLGRLVQDHDGSQDLLLQPGDVVTILSQRDVPVAQEMRTKYVRLEGEFAAAGVYSVQPGEDLAQLVQRAGGLTGKAYLYGSSFLRESARVLQQQRLDEYVTSLSSEMERATAVRGVSSASGVTDPTALLQEHSLINQLRSLRATGRILMEFTPDAQISSIPHLALEDGDVFQVPSRPGVISVLGAVYGQNVMLWNPQRKLSDYVSLAGNANRIADKDHAFIIRADGSVYSRQTAHSFLSNHFNGATVYPGDSIVIPEKTIKPTTLRQLIDYSQILSSFGLAAAAINVVR